MIRDRFLSKLIFTYFVYVLAPFLYDTLSFREAFIQDKNIQHIVYRTRDAEEVIIQVRIMILALVSQASCDFGNCLSLETGLPFTMIKGFNMLILCFI